jgi:hypothetical protein
MTRDPMPVSRDRQGAKKGATPLGISCSLLFVRGMDGSKPCLYLPIALLGIRYLAFRCQADMDPMRPTVGVNQSNFSGHGSGHGSVTVLVTFTNASG